MKKLFRKRSKSNEVQPLCNPSHTSKNRTKERFLRKARLLLSKNKDLSRYDWKGKVVWGTLHQKLYRDKAHCEEGSKTKNLTDLVNRAANEYLPEIDELMRQRDSSKTIPEAPVFYIESCLQDKSKLKIFFMKLKCKYLYRLLPDMFLYTRVAKALNSISAHMLDAKLPTGATIRDVLLNVSKATRDPFIRSAITFKNGVLKEEALKKQGDEQ